LNADVWFRRGRLFMVSPVHGDYRRCQAETPLIDLFKFAEPALRCKLHCKYAANFSRARSARLDKLLIELSGPRHHLSLSGCTQTWGQDWLDGEVRRACEAALRRPNKPSSFITKTVHQFPVSDIG
jgi:hypothetical protein